MRMARVEPDTLAVNRRAGYAKQRQRLLITPKLNTDFLQNPVGMCLKLLQLFFIQQFICRYDPLRDHRAGDAFRPPRCASGTATRPFNRRPQFELAVSRKVSFCVQDDWP